MPLKLELKLAKGPVVLDIKDEDYSKQVDSFFATHKIDATLQQELKKMIEESIGMALALRKTEVNSKEVNLIKDRNAFFRRIRCSSADRILLK